MATQTSGYNREDTIKETRERNVQKRNVTISKKQYIVFPEVFDPTLNDAFLARSEFARDAFLKAVHETMDSENRQQLTLLEIGTGMGYFAIEFALEFETGLAWAADVSPNAVENTAQNAALHGVENRVKAIQADVFDAASIKGMKFDLILFRPPTGYRGDCEAEDLDMLERSYYDPGLKIVKRYFTEARDYMAENGKLLLTYPLLQASNDLMIKIAKDAGWKPKVLAKFIPSVKNCCGMEFFEFIRL